MIKNDTGGERNILSIRLLRQILFPYFSYIERLRVAVDGKHHTACDRDKKYLEYDEVDDEHLRERFPVDQPADEDDKERHRLHHELDSDENPYKVVRYEDEIKSRDPDRSKEGGEYPEHLTA
jgi:hypothetical protein